MRGLAGVAKAMAAAAGVVVRVVRALVEAARVAA